MDFNRVTPPLGLLQGFNLHSYEALGNLARTCNEVFELKMDEEFTKEQFEVAFLGSSSTDNNYFGRSTWFIEHIYVQSERKIIPANETFDPMPKLMEIIYASKMEAVMREGNDGYSRWAKQVELPGCIVSITKIHQAPARKAATANQPATENPPMNHFEIVSNISPELFHLNAPILDQWYAQAALSHSDSVSIRFENNILVEETRSRLTTKLFKSGVRLVDNQKFDFEGLHFSFTKRPYLRHDEHTWSLDYQCKGNLFDNRLLRLLDRLFASEVFFERPPYLEL
jgi:hypothetical protein